jgi:hypothetical protein
VQVTHVRFVQSIAAVGLVACFGTLGVVGCGGASHAAGSETPHAGDDASAPSGAAKSDDSKATSDEGKGGKAVLRVRAYADTAPSKPWKCVQYVDILDVVKNDSGVDFPKDKQIEIGWTDRTQGFENLEKATLTLEPVKQGKQTYWQVDGAKDWEVCVDAHHRECNEYVKAPNHQ